MHYYYVDMYHEFMELNQARDDYWANIENIDDTCRQLRIRSVNNAKHREDGRPKVVGWDETLKQKLKLKWLANPDLFDCMRPINEYDMEYSVLSKYHSMKKR